MAEADKVKDLQGPKKTSRLKKLFKNESFRIVYVLVLLSFISAALLGLVNYFTQIDETKLTLDKISEIYPSPIKKTLDIGNYEQLSGTQIKGYYIAEDGANIILSKANKGDKTCYNTKGITIFVIIKNDVIVDVSSFDHSETPGLGENALKSKHLSQYVGINQTQFWIPDAQQIISPGGEGFSPTAVSGATYSTNGVNLAVKAAVKSYRHFAETITD